jgi:hypothetical protein
MSKVEAHPVCGIESIRFLPKFDGTFSEANGCFSGIKLASKK